MKPAPEIKHGIKQGRNCAKLGIPIQIQFPLSYLLQKLSSRETSFEENLLLKPPYLCLFHFLATSSPRWKSWASPVCPFLNISICNFSDADADFEADSTINEA
jgi:hypothetical protein